jgi:hypothetical protein
MKKIKVFVTLDVLDDLLSVFGADNVREMLSEYELVISEA